MPVVREASFGNIGLRLSEPVVSVAGDGRELRDLQRPSHLSLESLAGLSFRTEPAQYQFDVSPTAWALDLKSMVLNKSFEGFIANMFQAGNEVYFTSVGWDYSGAAPCVYPPKGTSASSWQFRLRKDDVKHFLGDGVGLWTSKDHVVGALNLVLFVYENDQGARDAGDVLASVHDVVNGSKLKELVEAISRTPQLATGVAIGEAVNELLGVVGKMMKNDRNDFVDQYEGSWLVSPERESERFDYRQDATSIQLTLTV